MRKKIMYLTVCAVLFALCLSAEAQQPEKIQRIGLLLASSPSAATSLLTAFQQGLRELAYEDGKNITIDYRYAEGKMERLPELAGELVRLKANVIVTQGIQPSQAAKRATNTIPIVFPGVGDPVGWGLVDSLARPGGNVTGLTNFLPELSGKRVELLKEAFPQLTRVAVFRDPGQPLRSFEEAQIASRAFGLKLQSLEIRNSSDVEQSFAAIAKERTDAIIPNSSVGNSR